MSSNSLRDQAAQKEREWRELEQLQYIFIFIYFVCLFIKLFHFC